MTDLERRMKRLAVLVPALAIIATCFGFIPHAIGVEIVPWNHDTAPYMSGRFMNGGGWALCAWTVVQCFFAADIRAKATRKRGWWWFGLSVVVTLGAGIGWIAEHFTLFDTLVPYWPADITFVFSAAAAVLVLLGLPIVLVVSESEPSDAPPPARVVERP